MERVESGITPETSRALLALVADWQAGRSFPQLHDLAEQLATHLSHYLSAPPVPTLTEADWQRIDLILTTPAGITDHDLAAKIRTLRAAPPVTPGECEIRFADMPIRTDPTMPVGVVQIEQCSTGAT